VYGWVGEDENDDFAVGAVIALKIEAGIMF
jgi:hypothetical protein